MLISFDYYFFALNLTTTSSLFHSITITYLFYDSAMLVLKMKRDLRSSEDILLMFHILRAAAATPAAVLMVSIVLRP